MTQTTRRAVLGGAAALPAMSLPAVAAPDPVFAAIEKFNALNAKLRGIVEPENADGNIEPDTPEYKAWRAAHDAASDKCWDAKNAVLATVPTTAAGALAFLKLFLSPELHFLVEDDDALFDSLVVYLERAA
jgi:hypothetical protein